jgi:hypothetical protein
MQIGIILKSIDNYYIYFVINDHIITIQLVKIKIMGLFQKVFIFYYKQCEKTYGMQLIFKN